jgi:hypothetical protein
MDPDADCKRCPGSKEDDMRDNRDSQDRSQQQDRSPARAKDQQSQRQGKEKTEDMPGADGPRSARADEDTYD